MFFFNSYNFVVSSNPISTMPTQISSTTKIMRRKSTGSSDITFETSRTMNRESPISSATSVSSEEQIFRRRISTAIKSLRDPVRTSGMKKKVDLKPTDKTDDSDECYNDLKNKPRNRLKAKKKSQNSIGSDEMLSSSDEDNLYDELNDSESDYNSPETPQSSTSFEDMVTFFQCNHY